MSIRLSIIGLAFCLVFTGSLGVCQAGGEIPARRHGVPLNEECARGYDVLDSARVDFHVSRQAVPTILEIIAQGSGLQATLEPALKSRVVSDLRHDGSATEALDRIATIANVVWWIDGGTIRMADSSRLETRSLDFPSARDLLREAASLCLPIDVVSIRASRSGGLLRARGPRVLIQDLAKLADELRPRYSRVGVLRYGRASTQPISR